MKYRGANIRLYKVPDMADVGAVLDGITGYGGNAVAVNTHHYARLEGSTLVRPPLAWGCGSAVIYADVGQDPDHPFKNTTPLEAVERVIEAALERGLKVLYKPMVDVAGWRGFVTVPPALLGAWEWAYRNVLLGPAIPMMKRHPQVDWVIGCEFVQFTRDYGPAPMIRIARWLRSKGVRNRLTYAANWGWWNDGDLPEYARLRDLWPLMDYVGIDMYAPMVPEDYAGPLSAGVLTDPENRQTGWWRTIAGAEHWMKPLLPSVTEFVQGVGKPLVLTEIGYGATPWAATDPAGDRGYAGPPTYDQSLPLLAAARTVWEPLADGILWWDAGQGTLTTTTHNILTDTLGGVVLGGSAE